jgi:hypothetical protein
MCKHSLHTALWLTVNIVTGLLLLTQTASASIPEILHIVVPYGANDDINAPNYYYIAALRLALTETHTQDGAFEISDFPANYGRERERTIIKNNQGLDLLWSTSTPQREEQLLAIKFNLLRKFSDYKILLIRTEDKDKFSAVKNISDLRKFRAGTGTHWQDTQILQKNNIPLVTSWDYDPMFKMLAAKRFDYIIRGTHEIWSDLELHKTLPFSAEETLLIRYPLPVFFFVNPGNTKLANRIQTGLEMAEKDGSLEKLMLSIPSFQKAQDVINDKQRLVLDFKE